MTQRISGERVLLSTAEASKVAKLGREYIQRLLRLGRLEGVKLGHDWLVYEDSLLAFLTEPRKPGPKGSRQASRTQHQHSMNTDIDTLQQLASETPSDETSTSSPFTLEG